MQTLLPSQGNHRLNAKTAQQLAVDVCKAHIGQGVRSPKIQSTHTSPQEKAQADENLGKRWTQRFLPRRSKERSEEHTSELQSRQYLVCRLLLEKKKKNINT